jgi:uncharacterized C2H2 Zn-finger protein
MAEQNERASDVRTEDGNGSASNSVEQLRETVAGLLDCPDCDALVRPERLGTHRYNEHGVNRRTNGTDKVRENAGNGSTNNPPIERLLGARTEEPPAKPATAECPDCGAVFQADRLGSHRYNAHGIDRREPEQEDRTRNPRAPQRRADEEGEEDSGDQERGEQKSRRASRWFGDR